jgi:uncharacterized protein with HEPN domain
MTRDDASLLDIYEAGRLIQEFIADMSKDAFLQDRKTQSAVLHKILILGEANQAYISELSPSPP